MQVSSTTILGTWVIMQFFIRDDAGLPFWQNPFLSFPSHHRSFFLLNYFKAQLLMHLVLSTTAHFNPVTCPAGPTLTIPIVMSLLHGSRSNLTESYVNRMLILSKLETDSFFFLTPELQQRSCRYASKVSLSSSYFLPQWCWDTESSASPLITGSGSGTCQNQ